MTRALRRLVGTPGCRSPKGVGGADACVAGGWVGGRLTESMVNSPHPCAQNQRGKMSVRPRKAATASPSYSARSSESRFGLSDECVYTRKRPALGERANVFKTGSVPSKCMAESRSHMSASRKRNCLTCNGSGPSARAVAKAHKEWWWKHLRCTFNCTRERRKDGTHDVAEPST